MQHVIRVSGTRYVLDRCDRVPSHARFDDATIDKCSVFPTRAMARAVAAEYGRGVVVPYERELRRQGHAEES